MLRIPRAALEAKEAQEFNSVSHVRDLENRCFAIHVVEFLITYDIVAQVMLEPLLWMITSVCGALRCR